MQSENGLPELKAAMAKCRWHFVAVAVFSVFVNLLMLTGPLFMLQIYDRVLTSRSEATLVALLVVVTGLFLMMGVLEFIRGRVLARAGARFQSLLDSRVMIAVLRRSVQPAERARPNTAARDLEAVRQLLGGPAPFALFDMPWVPIFIAVIFLFHPLLGWLSVFGALILVVLTLLNQIRSRTPSAESQRATSEAENLGEALRQNAETVQGLGMRDVGLKRWIAMRQEALGRQVVASDRTAGYTASSKALRFYLQSVMLATGAWLVLQQEMSAGMMIAGSIMLGRALAPVEQAIGQWGLAQRAARGWSSLVELLEKTPPETQKTALPVPKGFVDVQGVTVAAPGENYPVLRAINFKVQPGMALGVIGPSGAGKTTLAKVLIGIWRPVAGKVRIDGAAMDQWPEDIIGKHLGYLPQEIGLMSGTVAENIARMAEDRDDAEVVAAAQRAGAHELLLALPQGYDTQIGAGGQRLSGGQRQRVALARALYGDPPVLVLDEPNANLDAPGEQALVDAIRDAKSRGKTVIIMAHRPSAIAACDLLLMIDKGVQIDFGPRDEVLKKRTKNYAQLPGGEDVQQGPAPTQPQPPAQPGPVASGGISLGSMPMPSIVTQKPPAQAPARAPASAARSAPAPVFKTEAKTALKPALKPASKTGPKTGPDAGTQQPAEPRLAEQASAKRPPAAHPADRQPGGGATIAAPSVRLATRAPGAATATQGAMMTTPDRAEDRDEEPAESLDVPASALIDFPGDEASAAATSRALKGETPDDGADGSATEAATETAAAEPEPDAAADVAKAPADDDAGGASEATVSAEPDAEPESEPKDGSQEGLPGEPLVAFSDVSLPEGAHKPLDVFLAESEEAEKAAAREAEIRAHDDGQALEKVTRAVAPEEDEEELLELKPSQLEGGRGVPEDQPVSAPEAPPSGDVVDRKGAGARTGRGRFFSVFAPPADDDENGLDRDAADSYMSRRISGVDDDAGNGTGDSTGDGRGASAEKSDKKRKSGGKARTGTSGDKR